MEAVYEPTKVEIESYASDGGNIIKAYAFVGSLEKLNRMREMSGLQKVTELQDLMPGENYLNTLIIGAKQANLNESYIQKLEALHQTCAKIKDLRLDLTPHSEVTYIFLHTQKKYAQTLVNKYPQFRNSQNTLSPAFFPLHPPIFFVLKSLTRG